MTVLHADEIARAAALNPDEFEAFFSALWPGMSPFPWQSRLARRVAAGEWPQALALPTAAGKTAVIDIAIFHLALEATRGSLRRAPVRMVFVVDRRLVVDDAYRRAQHISQALAAAREGVLFRVAERLRWLSGPEESLPLRAVLLRGGMPREPDWARTPSQPTVCLSTVDQAGSRLLFRGYGVTDRMRPVHAGLMGSDVLIFLDEAHLSGPFAQTLASVQRARERAAKRGGQGAFRVVSLSATLSERPEDLFELSAEDRSNDVLRRRLEARKQTRLVTSRAENDSERAAELAVAALGLSALRGKQAQVVAVVVNRVRLARRVHELLEQQIRKEGLQADVVLLTGRSRPLDRERLLQDVLPRMRAGTRQTGLPLFVVATQCVEAGADLDFDALVTQVAPLDCLRQRFGRLDRLGSKQQSDAIIVAHTSEVGGRAAEDPIYGGALGPAWGWLKERAGRKEVLDFGVAHLSVEDAPQAAFALRRQAPVLLPAYIDAWTQTSPPPAADPEVSLFLHGPGERPADVLVVWRADLEGVLATRGGEDGEAEAEPRWRHLLALAPPVALEAVAVPVGLVRAWLEERGAEDAPLADVEGVEEARDAERARPSSRPAVRWLGSDDDRTRVVTARGVRPGEVIVVPASYGGLDQFGWRPGSGRRVMDLASEAVLRQRHRVVLRLSRSLLLQELESMKSEGGTSEARAQHAGALWGRLSEAHGKYADRPVDFLRAAMELRGLPPRWRSLLMRLLPKADGGAGCGVDLVAFTSAEAREEVLVVRGQRPLDRNAALALITELERHERAPGEGRERADAADELAGDPTTEGDAGSFLGVSVPLRQHSLGVERQARMFAERAGLPPERVQDVALAAYLHDVGKAERRFQAYLHGGDELAALAAEEPLAKSGRASSASQRDQARRRAELPRGARHECWSVVLASKHPRFQEATDPDLVLWLIGTHHGYGRPFFPPVDDPAPHGSVTADLGDGEMTAPVDHGLTRLDSGWAERFERLKLHYGPWELARCEAVLRLADHRTSQAEQRAQEVEHA